MEEASPNQPVPEQKKRSGAGPMVAIIAILVILGLGLALVSGKKDTTKAASNATPAVADADRDKGSDKMMAETESPITSAMVSSDTITVNVEAGAFYYKPTAMTVKKGQKVKIVMKSADMMHDFIIDELGVKLPITKSGETNSVDFTPDKTGTFEYYCSVGQHRAKGQVGKITVE